MFASLPFRSWAYMLSHQLLLRSGVDSSVDLAQIQFHQHAEGVIREVREGRVDFGCVRTGELERAGAEEEFVVVNSVTVPGFPYLLSTELLAATTLAAFPGVDHGLAQKVTAALLALQPEPQSRIGGFSLAG